jgi:hypothetical protein
VKKRLANFLIVTSLLALPVTALAGPDGSFGGTGYGGGNNNGGSGGGGAATQQTKPSASKSTGGYVLGYVKTSLDARDGNAPSPGLGQG